MPSTRKMLKRFFYYFFDFNDFTLACAAGPFFKFFSSCHLFSPPYYISRIAYSFSFELCFSTTEHSLHHFVMYVKYFYISLCDNYSMWTAKAVGRNLSRARKDKKLTQREVARRMHMTQQQYSRFENGVYELNYDQILYFCALYDITPSDLFDIDD